MIFSKLFLSAEKKSLPLTLQMNINSKLIFYILGQHNLNQEQPHQQLAQAMSTIQQNSTTTTPMERGNVSSVLIKQWTPFSISVDTCVLVILVLFIWKLDQKHVQCVEHPLEMSLRHTVKLTTSNLDWPNPLTFFYILYTLSFTDWYL